MDESPRGRAIALPFRIEDAVGRPLRFALSDGVSDVPPGLALAVVAGLCALGRLWSEGRLYWILAGFASGLCVFAVPYANRMLRERFIYPRGGYVAFEPVAGPSRRLLYQVFVAIAIAVLVMLSATFAMERVWGFGPGVGFMALLLFGRPTLRLPVVAAVALCLALGLWFYRDPALYSTAFALTAGFGLTSSALGLWRFWTFCRKNPRQAVGDA